LTPRVFIAKIRSYEKSCQQTAKNKKILELEVPKTDAEAARQSAPNYVFILMPFWQHGRVSESFSPGVDV
jgi:hypothetical protein